MNWKDIRTGKEVTTGADTQVEVTWGTGDIRGKITQTHPKTKECTVQLSRDYISPCGMTFPKGHCAKIPAGELRYVS